MAGFFSYFNDDPTNIRNVAEWGGGGLTDIGCYLVHTSRMLFEREPVRVCALMERDPAMRVDRLTSVMFDFAGAQSIGTCSTQLVPYQRVHLFGTRGRIEIPIPFNSPPDRATRIFVDDGSDSEGSEFPDDSVRRLRPVHDPGRLAVARHPRPPAGAVPAGRLRPEHAGDLRAGALGGCRDRGLGSSRLLKK